jgi:hypothetical protein
MLPCPPAGVLVGPLAHPHSSVPLLTLQVEKSDTRSALGALAQSTAGTLTQQRHAVLALAQPVCLTTSARAKTDTLVQCYTESQHTLLSLQLEC